MTDNTGGCAGCGSSGSDSPDVENIKLKMEETQRSLQTMLSSMESFKVNSDPYSELDTHLNRITSILNTPNMQSTIEKAMELSLKSKALAMGETLTPVKTPVGWVYVDENGQQQFSPTEPEGVTSTPVYA